MYFNWHEKTIILLQRRPAIDYKNESIKCLQIDTEMVELQLYS